jgi:hypothetical protein
MKKLTFLFLIVFGAFIVNAQKNVLNQTGLAKSSQLTISQNSTFAPDYAGVNADTTVIYEQMAAATSGSSSQDFETAYDAYDNEAADDFIVTGGPWNINFITCYGSYSSGSGPLEYVNIIFYNDNSGVPGTEVQSFANIPCSVDDATGLVSINLPSTVTLNDGTYWLSIIARMDYATGGQWFHTYATSSNGAHWQWRNPGDGFGTGQTDWGDGDATENDLTFGLYNLVLSALDLSTIAASPTWIMGGNSAVPSITVKNMGSSAISDFSVNMVINDGTSDV